MEHLSVEDALKTIHFRVVIFGSARIKSDDDHYQRVYRVAKRLGELGIDVVTGGGPGLMEAANKGHQDGRKSDVTKSLGINITLPFEQHPNKHLDITEEKEKFSSRLDEFMRLSDVLLVADGGIGTLLELFYTWQLLQVGKISFRPIILLGEQWSGLIQWMMKEQLSRELLSKNDFRFINIAENEHEALALIESEYRKFLLEHPEYEEELASGVQKNKSKTTKK